MLLNFAKQPQHSFSLLSLKKKKRIRCNTKRTSSCFCSKLIKWIWKILAILRYTENVERERKTGRKSKNKTRWFRNWTARNYYLSPEARREGKLIAGPLHHSLLLSLLEREERIPSNINKSVNHGRRTFRYSLPTVYRVQRSPQKRVRDLVLDTRNTVARMILSAP